QPGEPAFVVAALEGAGAIAVGKTNLDQFATGLVGTRSPHGAVPNAFRPEMISGGSSSGSAVAVALGQVHFALGTDTAGSGRVPERLAAVRSFFEASPHEVEPTVRAILQGARAFSASDAFVAEAWLDTVRLGLAAAWEDVDVLLVPTAPTAYSIAQVEADPIE